MKCGNCGSVINEISNVCPVCSCQLQLPSNSLNNVVSQNVVGDGSVVNQVSFVDGLNTNSNSALDNSDSLNQTDVKKPKKRFGFIKFLIIILIIAILGIIGYFWFINQPQYVFKSTFDVLKSEIYNSFSINRKPYQTSYSLSFELNTDAPIYGELYRNINDINADFVLYSNIEEEYLFFDLITTYQYKNHLNFNGFLDRNILYLNSPSDFKEYYSFDTYINVMNMFNNVSDKEILDIFNSFITAFSYSLSNDDFIREESIQEVDGKQVNLVSNTLIINSNNYKEIFNKLINKLIKDEIFINTVSKARNINGIDFIGELNNLLDSINKSNIKFGDYEFSLYTDEDDNFIGYGFKINDELYTIIVNDKNIKVFKKYNEKIFEIIIEENRYVISFSGGNIYLNFKKVENPLFTKPDVSNNILFNSLSDSEKEEVFKSINDGNVMKNFMIDFQRFITLVDMKFDEFILPSKEEFYNDIYSLIDSSLNHYLYSSSSGNIVYTNDATIPGVRLDFNTFNSTYYVKIDDSGGIKRLVYYNNNYCFDSSNINNLKYLVKESVASKYFWIRTRKDSYEGCKSQISLFD